MAPVQAPGVAGKAEALAAVFAGEPPVVAAWLRLAFFCSVTRRYHDFRPTLAVYDRARYGRYFAAAPTRATP